MHTDLTLHGALGQPLRVRLELPADAEPVAWALFAHCFTCDAGLESASRIARALAAERIAVARLDFTGRGEAGEQAAVDGVVATPADLAAVAAGLATAGRAPAILVGHSLGGTALLVAAREIPSARAMVTIGSAHDPATAGELLTGASREAIAHGRAAVAFAGVQYTLTRELFDALRPPAVADALRDSKLPLLVFHSPVDETVPLEEAQQLFAAAHHPKSFVSLDDADHLITRARDAEYVADVAASWVRRYVDVHPHRSRPELERGTGVVATTGAAGFHTEILAGGHPLVADEPASVGGTETGPSPYDFLAAALGACTSMTLQMYARRKGWPLESATVRLTHKKIHALDEDEVPAVPVRLDHIDRELELEGPLDDEQRARLAEIADRCPVHRTLEQGVTVSTAVKPRE